jgi:hypothetical protein
VQPVAWNASHELSDLVDEWQGGSLSISGIKVHETKEKWRAVLSFCQGLFPLHFGYECERNQNAGTSAVRRI